MKKNKRPPLTATQKARLKELQDSIRREAPFIGRKPYSHNIVRLDLGFIANEFGGEEANKTVRKFKLDRLGFNEEPVEDDE